MSTQLTPDRDQRVLAAHLAERDALRAAGLTSAIVTRTYTLKVIVEQTGTEHDSVAWSTTLAALRAAPGVVYVAGLTHEVKPA